MSKTPLLMIPGPIEISDRVREAASSPPPSHVSPALIEAFGTSIEQMRRVWLAAADSQPFAIAGSGTIAMDVAVANLVDPGDRIVLVDTGYFSERMRRMLERRGADVTVVAAAPGDAPSLEDVDTALTAAPTHALFATHVDTSTGVRVDARGLAEVAHAHDALTVLDGVCATAGEELQMDGWGVDVYLTASQKAIGLPAGLALLVVTKRAMEIRHGLKNPPPLSLDWLEWRPVMQAYEERRPAYFSTPATTLILALHAGLDEILGDADDPATAMTSRFDLHARTADALRTAWGILGLTLLPARRDVTANTLSAISYPDGVGTELVGAIRNEGVIVAPGLHPQLRDTYFRVGHMGDVLTRPADVARCVRAVGLGLRACGQEVDIDAALAAVE